MTAMHHHHHHHHQQQQKHQRRRRTSVGETPRALVLAAALAVVTLAVPVRGARILAVETVAGRSPWNVVGAVLGALADNGHHVTVLTPFRDGDRDNYTEVDTSAEFPRALLDLDAADTLRRWGPPAAMIGYMRDNSARYCDSVMYTNAVLGRLIRDAADGLRPPYDLVIVKSVGRRCVQRLATALRVPSVQIVTSAMETFVERPVHGHAPSPAAVSHLFADHAVPRTFSQRLHNAYLYAYTSLVIGLDEWWREHVAADPRPHHRVDRLDPPSLVFVNSHVSCSEPARPFPPGVVEIGGIHLRRPYDGVPHDILEFIEHSPHGVILFTFGSIINLSTLPENILNAIKEALAQVPQRILLKYEGEMENKPENVMIRKWLPQRAILRHPNVKLFISHGGLSGIYESVDAAVPILGIPLFYDQPKNVATLVDAGMAISIDLLSIKKDTLIRNILELVTNEKYKKNAEKVSDLFKDRPMTPEQSVLYWTEYVIRHKGAPHLKSHALNLTWYQYFLLDVIAVVIIFVSISLFILYNVLKTIYNFVIIKTLFRIKNKSD